MSRCKSFMGDDFEKLVRAIDEYIVNVDVINIVVNIDHLARSNWYRMIVIYNEKTTAVNTHV